MQTANLTGALLDYWTARAEGVPADQLEIRPVQRPDPRTPDSICVRRMPYRDPIIGPDEVALPYSTSWWLSGPLIDKHGMTVRPPERCVPWEAHAWRDSYWYEGAGNTPLIAICRAVVRAAFGDEVEDLPCS
jgi:Protein of unknown function (DUF2591)